MLLKAGAGDSGVRIDKLISDKTGITRSQIRRFIDEDRVLVGGAPVRANYRARAHDEILLTLPEKPSEGLIAEDIPLNLLFADEHIAVVDKPPGMVVYPAAGHPSGTLMNALLYRFKLLNAPGGPLRPGVVHRLDKDTSGAMVVALSAKAYYGLVEQFKARTIEKEYIALVYGKIKGDRGEIASALGRSGSDRKKMSTRSRRAKEARTEWEVAERLKGATLVKIRLKTGRTHQIRVHFASIGHPVLGDTLYGGKTHIGKTHFKRQLLHSARLVFIHPITGKRVEFESPMPHDMREAADALRVDSAFLA